MKEKYREKELFRLSEGNWFALEIFLKKKKRKDYFGHHTLCSIDVQLAGFPYSDLFAGWVKSRF